MSQEEKEKERRNFKTLYKARQQLSVNFEAPKQLKKYQTVAKPLNESNSNVNMPLIKIRVKIYYNTISQ